MSKKGKKRKGPTKSESSSSAAKTESRAPQPHRPVVPSLTELQTATSTAASSSLSSAKKYVTVFDGPVYEKIMRDHYAGFVHMPATQVSSLFHTQAKLALEKLRDAGYYQYDMVMAGGKNLSRTFVQRTLVGEPGITYKYLGLRLFAHAWSGGTTSDLFRGIHVMNQEMIRLTREQLRLHHRSSTLQSYNNTVSPTGSCEYNLTLINYMEPSSETVLRDEEKYGMGKASVSWHADSSLQDYSSIGVYHTLPTQKASTWDWKIALRRNPPEPNPQRANSVVTTTSADADAHVPPVVVATKSGDVYFLLREFNHTHQHMVLAGSSARRISSTHRVAVETTDTYEYIRSRCSQALVATKVQLKKKHVHEWDTATLLDAQAVLTEVEFEWIAQYWVQGAQHDVQHVWWQAPMRALEQAWGALEKLSQKMYNQAIAAVPETTAADVEPNSDDTTGTRIDHLSQLLTGLHKAFSLRHEWRIKWDERRADKIYKRRISRPYQPVEHPIFVSDLEWSKHRLPKDLTEPLSQLAQALQNNQNVWHHTTAVTAGNRTKPHTTELSPKAKRRKRK